MKNKLTVLLQATLLAGGLVSCEYIHEDLEPCPPKETGLDVRFRYDYNLQRADMFADHVGSVTVYVFDEGGHFLMKQTESGKPLEADGYAMRIPLEPGRYQYLVEAFQKPYEEAIAGEGADFLRTEPTEGDSLSALTHRLEYDEDGLVAHAGLPLDTLWHGMQTLPIEVFPDSVTCDTVSLVRNTKQISVALREVDEPENIDVADYDFRIIDRNGLLLWDNRVDETDQLTYTPFATRNTTDKAGSNNTEGIGKIAHADFMTSRLLYHESAADDAILSITNKRTGVEVIRVNLPDILSRLRTAADIYRYTPQEFLDRGYDYQLTFFLKGDRWEYVNVEISVLSWAKRIQYEHIEI